MSTAIITPVTIPGIVLQLQIIANAILLCVCFRIYLHLSYLMVPLHTDALYSNIECPTKRKFSSFQVSALI